MLPAEECYWAAVASHTEGLCSLLGFSRGMYIRYSINFLNVKFLVAIFIIGFPVIAWTQKPQHNGFGKEASRATGDLNKDGTTDLAIVLLETANNASHYRLQIFFGQPNNTYRLVTNTIKPIKPKSDFNNGVDFDEITITNNVLTIGVQLLRGHYEHKFRYQNGHFELIGYSEVSSDGLGTVTSTDFNLSTGTRIEKKESADSDKILSNKKQKILIRPLPNLEHFVPLESEYY